MKYQKKLHASERWPLPSLLNFTRSWPCFSSTGVECAPECNLTTFKKIFYLAPYTYWHIIFPSGACNSRLPWKGGPFSQKRFHFWEVSQSQNEKKRTQSKGHINLFLCVSAESCFWVAKTYYPHPWHLTSSDLLALTKNNSVLVPEHSPSLLPCHPSPPNHPGCLQTLHQPRLFISPPFFHPKNIFLFSTPSLWCFKVGLLLVGFLGGSVVKKPSPNVGDMVQSQGQDDPLEKEMATHSSVLAWEIPWTEEPAGLKPTGSQSRTRLTRLRLNRLTLNISWW